MECGASEQMWVCVYEREKRKIVQEKWNVCVLGRDRKRERGRKKYGETEREYSTVPDVTE